MFTNISRPSVVDVQMPFAVGDLFAADSTTTVVKIPDTAVGNVLLSSGVGAVPAWGKVTLSSHVSGVLPAINGGTGVANTGTITNASNTTITGGGTLALGGFTLTVPATGTAGLLGVANTWTAANVFSSTVQLDTSSNGLTISKTTGTTLTISSTNDTAISCAGGIVAEAGAYLGSDTGNPVFMNNALAKDLTNFAILQTSGGTTILNCTSGQSVIISHGNSASQLTVTGSTATFGTAVDVVLAKTTGATLTVSSTDTTASAVLNGGLTIATGKNVRHGTAAIATNATDGFIYAPTCAGTPTGTPTTLTGTAPIVIDTTNHKLYFFSGGSWRDAGP